MSVDWYYALGDERKGPVNDQEFQRLIQLGIITRGTLVWNETMENWQPHMEAPPTPPPLKVASDTVRWASCNGCRKTFQESELVQLSEMRFCQTCKDLAVQKMREGVSDNQDEEIRKQYLGHEASVRSIGTLYLLGGLCFLLLAFPILLGNAQHMPPGPFSPGTNQAFMVTLFAIMGLGQTSLGIGLRRLKSWTRIPVACLSALGLLAFPLGTLINAYILYLVLSEKGKRVYSDDYKAIIERTPHIRYRTSRILLGLIVFIAILCILGLVSWWSTRH